MISKESVNALGLKKLRIGSFNCQGIKGKFEDPIFEKELNEHDIFAVSETWLSNEDKISMEGYKFFPVCREKELGKIRGGIGWFVREDLRKWIKILYNISSENFIWSKLDKTFFNFNEDLYICSVYIPPENSSREKRMNKNHFIELAEKINKIKSENIILIGDFNARTKIFDDVIEYEDDINDHMPAALLSCIKTLRSNQDKKGNKYGRSLVDLCLKQNLYIANGRTLGDLRGKVTCYQKKGASLVDYAIISEKLHSCVYTLNISDPFLASDHSVLKLTLKLPKETTQIVSNEKKISSIKWNEKTEKKFLNFMKLPSTIIKIKEIENEVENGIEKDIDKCFKKRVAKRVR